MNFPFGPYLAKIDLAMPDLAATSLGSRRAATIGRSSRWLWAALPAVLAPALAASEPPAHPTPPPAPTPPALSTSPTRDLAAALAVAMSVHDDAVRSMAWSQILTVAGDTPPIMTVRSEQAFDEQGRWFCHALSLDDETVMHDDTRVFDGVLLAGAGNTSRRGTIRSYAGDRKSQESIDCWLGRHVDVNGHKRLAEFLLASADLQLQGFSERHLPVVAATCDIPPTVAWLEVEIDPEHGFAPRTITLRDRLIKVPCWRWETLEFTRVQGVWLPAVGRFSTRYFEPTPDQSRRLDAAITARGLNKPLNGLDPAVHAAFAQIIPEVFGSGEAPSLPLTPDHLNTFSNIHLNTPLPGSLFQFSPPADVTLFDATIDCVRLPGEPAWRPQ